MWYKIAEIDYQELTKKRKFVAACIIFKKQNDKIEVLLEKRGTPPNKNKWCIPGGHVEIGENPIDAAVREIKEETNLTLNPNKLIHLTDNNSKGKFIKVYFCLYEGNEVAKAGSDADDLSWSTIENMPDLIYNNAELIQKAYNKLF